MRDKWVIWPIYFDSEASRKDGRKIAKEIAVRNPTIDEIFQAARKLGLNPLKEEKAHPKRWWRKEGRLLVEKKGRKIDVLKSIGEIVSSKRKQNK